MLKWLKYRSDRKRLRLIWEIHLHDAKEKARSLGDVEEEIEKQPWILALTYLSVRARPDPSINGQMRYRQKKFLAANLRRVERFESAFSLRERDAASRREEGLPVPHEPPQEIPQEMKSWRVAIAATDREQWEWICGTVPKLAVGRMFAIALGNEPKL
jgi:hypothetical protein